MEIKRTNLDSRYYLSTSKGGYNKCLVINKKTGSVLPNCVGYAYGRYMEMANIKKCDLPTINACKWFANSNKFEHGKIPKIGAVACWKFGRGNFGHVGIVEEITNDYIKISMSAYKGTIYYIRTFQRNKHLDYNGLVFQGYMYNKDLDITLGELGASSGQESHKDYNDLLKDVLDNKFGTGATRFDNLKKIGIEPVGIQEDINELYKVARLVINGCYGNGKIRKDRLEADGYNYDLVQKVVNILMNIKKGV